jgi:hypothetical protein
VAAAYRPCRVAYGSDGSAAAWVMVSTVARASATPFEVKSLLAAEARQPASVVG